MNTYKKVKAQTYQKRFDFLVQLDDKGHRLFQLYTPDLLEFRWTVWDMEAKCTIGYGLSAIAAVDTAMHNVDMKNCLRNNSPVCQ